MKYLIAAACVVVLLSGCRDDTPSAHNEITPSGIEYTRLYMPEAKYVAIQIAWPTNWAFRDNVNQAIPYIGANLILAGGAEGFPAGEVDEIFNDLNAEAHLDVTPEYIFGALAAPEDDLRKVVEIANAHLRSPTLNQDWLERIRDGFFDNVTEFSAQPKNKGFNAIRWAILGDTPLRKALSVDPLSMIMDVTLEDVAKWHQEQFTRRGIKIVIAGKIEADVAEMAIDTLMMGLPEGNPQAVKHTEANFKPRRILLHIPDASTSMLTFITPLPPTRDGGEAEDIILVEQLGGSDQSVLFDTVRTRLRASYDFSATIDGYARSIRFLALTGEVETDKIAQTEIAVRDAYMNFRKTGISSTIDNLKKPLAASMEETMKDPGATSYTALLGMLDDQEPGFVFQLTDTLDKVTRETLNDRLMNILPASNAFVTLAVSPNADALPKACIITAPVQAANCQ